MGHLRLWIIGVVVIGLAGTAHASPLDMFGFGSRGAAMANAHVASNNEYSAVYYNWACMTRSEKTSSFGFMYVFDDVYIRLKDRPEGNFDPLGYDNRLNPRRDTNSLLNNQGFNFGLIHNMWTERFRVGVGIYIPTNAIQTQQSHFNDEFEQYFSNQLKFELLGARTRKQVVNFGVAYKFADWFSAGIGGSLFQDSITNTYTYQPSVLAFEDIFLNLDNEQVFTFSGSYGLLFTHNEDWHLGVSFRDQVTFGLSGNNVIQVGGLSEGESALRQEIDILIQYTPAQVQMGLAYEGFEKWVVEAGMTWYQWSEYTNTQNDPVQPELNDIYCPQIGAEYQVNDDWVLRGGYKFEPSPIEDTPGRYNYVDNDRHVVSFGAGLVRPFMKDKTFNIDLHVQVHFLQDRSITKDLNDPDNPIVDEFPAEPGIQTGNPGWPGWTSGGTLVNTGFSLTFKDIFFR